MDFMRMDLHALFLMQAQAFVCLPCTFQRGNTVFMNLPRFVTTIACTVPVAMRSAMEVGRARPAMVCLRPWMWKEVLV
ncbi:MAG: hypothetical protein CVU65_10410 [Deltaproteobacteria bacterium HGW-Deltaproteobacteria-22]|nr:MAG: hypothetical protein CVU65_10410 [Deltaproteobacteria bacterium HGW-Deltaproteobacteria-22]